MRVACPVCHKSYRINEGRLPANKEICFPCPSCKKGVIRINWNTQAYIEAFEPHKRGTSETPLPKEQGTQVPKDKILSRASKDFAPMSQSVLKALDILSNPNANFKELADIVSTDQALAARVLKLANSAYYGIKGNVSSIHHACSLLGFKPLGELITIAGTSGLLSSRLRGYGMKTGDLWRHSLATAFGAKTIANMKMPELADAAFAAGLIHDAGKILLDPYVHEKKELFERFMGKGRRSYLDAETEILGFDHSEITHEMCKRWNIPEELSLAVRYHHYPSHTKDNALAYLVHMADFLALTSPIADSTEARCVQRDDKALALLDLRQEDLGTIMYEAIHSADEITEHL